MPSRWFRIAYAENAFRRFLDARGTALPGLRAPEATTLVLAFYREYRAQHARITDEGDGLLWQWGPDADAERFTVDLTRQLVRDEDDAPMDAEGFARIRERARLRAEGKPLQVWAHGADPADNVETPAHVPTPPSAAQISAADALFATALRSDEPDGFGDFSDEFLENFGV